MTDRTPSLTAPPPTLRGLLALGLLLLIAGCGGTDRAATDDPAPSRSPDSLYRAAIADARSAEPSDIVTTLTPIVPHNDDLVWKNRRDSTRRVRVVTWTGSRASSIPAAGDTMTITEDLWVTAVPELRSFCQDLPQTGDRLDRRIAQRLGLPPDVDYDRFVELWVRPQDLVRPCPDPEVSDRECELRTPVPARHASVSDAHQKWFRDLKRTSYGPDGYPFTGLGYTYDWHPDTDDIGPSEFVLRPDSTAGAQSPGRAVVHTVQSTDAYCRAGSGR
ncbi:MAG: hypothetical protein R6T83_10760 [Salinibacter sp.]